MAPSAPTADPTPATIVAVWRDEDAEDPKDDHGPLRVIRVALEWSCYTSDGQTLRILYPHSGGSGSLSEVIVSAGSEVVAVTLFRRAIVGTYPDGTSSLETLDLQYSAVAVLLDEPLGRRTVIDGSTGSPGRPFSPTEPSWLERTARDGCPLWIP